MKAKTQKAKTAKAKTVKAVGAVGDMEVLAKVGKFSLVHNRKNKSLILTFPYDDKKKGIRKSHTPTKDKLDGQTRKDEVVGFIDRIDEDLYCLGGLRVQMPVRMTGKLLKDFPTFREKCPWGASGYDSPGISTWQSAADYEEYQNWLKAKKAKSKKAKAPKSGGKK